MEVGHLQQAAWISARVCTSWLAQKSADALHGLTHSLKQLKVKKQAGTLTKYEVEILQIKLTHETSSTVETLIAERHYFKKGSATVDPRFLVFENMFNMLLRSRQVQPCVHLC